MRDIRQYCLLDANVLAGYYAPQTFRNSLAVARTRITTIVDSVRKGNAPDIKLIVPEICVAETQTVLSKHANPKWKGTKKRDDPQAIYGKAYKGIVKRLREDLHGGSLIESIPLQRYHVLAKHFITAIDHHTRITNQQGTKHINELGGTDQLVCGMAIWLNRLFGGRVVVLTTDYRMAKILIKAKNTKIEQAKRWGLLEIAESMGCDWSAESYPHAIDLARCSEGVLRKQFIRWPLSIVTSRRDARKTVTQSDIDILITRYRALGRGRDRLPYSNDMKLLVDEFNRATGHNMPEGDLWTVLLARLKKGDGKTRLL